MGAEALVCARQRLPQFSLRPFRSLSRLTVIILLQDFGLVLLGIDGAGFFASRRPVHLSRASSSSQEEVLQSCPTRFCSEKCPPALTRRTVVAFGFSAVSHHSATLPSMS